MLRFRRGGRSGLVGTGSKGMYMMCYVMMVMREIPCIFGNCPGSATNGNPMMKWRQGLTISIKKIG
jgi:hypothetical protein